MPLNRRNTIVGLGALAVGGGALLSTGAFTTVEATRDINVDVAGDSGAFLTINADVSPYANEVEGTVQIDLDGTSGSGAGDGLNLNAVTTVDPILEITNNSENNFGFYLDAEGGDVTVTNRVRFEVGVVDTNDSNADKGSLDIIFEDSNGNVIIHGGNPSAGDSAVVELDTGQSEQIGITVDTNNVITDGSISDYQVQIDSIIINAESDLNTS